MSYITVPEAQAWCEETRLTLESIDGELEESIAVQTISRLTSTYDTSTWVDGASTPSLVNKIIAMLYVAAWYDRVFSTSDAGSVYAARLRALAEDLILGIIAGTNELTDSGQDAGVTSGPSSYPNDASSALPPTPD